MKTIADRWAEFEATVIPKDAHATQRIEMRRSFYCGFHAALQATLEMVDESGDSEDVGMTIIQRLHDECQQFKRDVEAGRA